MKQFFYLGLLSLSVLSFISGCASVPLQPGAENVFITAPPTPKGCHYVGIVGIPALDSFNWVYARDHILNSMALNLLRNQGLALDANLIVISNYGTNGFAIPIYNNTVSGNAYFCDYLPATAPAQLTKLNFYLQTPFAVDRDNLIAVK
jgi:hypothetical protein